MRLTQKQIAGVALWICAAAAMIALISYVETLDSSGDDNGSMSPEISDHDISDISDTYMFFLGMMASLLTTTNTSQAQAMLFLDNTDDFQGHSIIDLDLMPYYVCSNTPDLRAHEREDELRSIFDIKEENNMRVVYNRVDTTCFLAGLPTNGVVNVDDFDQEAYPYLKLTPLHKVRPNNVDLTQSNITLQENVVVLQLCPHVPDTSLPNEATDLFDYFGISSGEQLDSFLEMLPWSQDGYLEHLNETVVEIPDSVLAVINALSSEVNCSNIFDNGFAIEYEYGLNFLVTFPEMTNVQCVLQYVMALTNINEVCSVEQRAPSFVGNIEAQWIIQSGVENNGLPWYEKGIDGTGIIVTASDSGMDTNNCYFWDSSEGELRDGTVQMERRKVVYYNNYKDDSDTYDGHGTHVTGIIAGRRAIDGITESNGIADGVARGAKLAFFDIGLDSVCCYVPGVNSYLGSSYYATGSKIHSASWGSLDSSYTSGASSVDSYLAEHDDLLFVVAAGNSGSSTTLSTLASPGTAKNSVTVGASESEGTEITSSMYGKDYLAYFSSRGPTLDGRIKPDVVAPGFYILSAGSRPSSVGECDPLDASDIPRAPGYSISSDYGLFYTSGTSMATPAVSGTAAMIRQYLMTGYFPSGSKNDNDVISNPSAALIKAILINGAVSLKGISNFGSILPIAEYDHNQGFGRVNLLTSLPIEDANDIAAEIYDREIITGGEIKEYSFSIAETCCQDHFSITLVWSDPASSAGCSLCLVNDLDLLVTKNNIDYFPNGLSTKDIVNNVERIRVAAIEGDVFTVSVIGSNLSSESQAFSLVATGCFGGRTNIGYTPETCSAALAREVECPTVNVCSCDSNLECSTIDTGSEFFNVCITSESEEFYFYAIESLIIYDDDGLSFTLVDNGDISSNIVGSTIETTEEQIIISFPTENALSSMSTSSNHFLSGSAVMSRRDSFSQCKATFISDAVLEFSSASGTSSTSTMSQSSVSLFSCELIFFVVSLATVQSIIDL